ncbi:hypothetical protein [Bacillus cereus]|uniref:hypothetical protein n=1 Tax=Bacillus cereus TaxID=1396 RepID=UPI003A8BEEBE
MFKGIGSIGYIYESVFLQMYIKDQNEERQIRNMKDLRGENRYIVIDKQSCRNIQYENHQMLKHFVRTNNIIMF